MNAVVKSTEQTVDFLVRPLTGDDSNAYRQIRQHILDIGDGRYFSDSYQREARLTTEQLWRDWCTENRGHCIIGAFANQKLIGVMMVTQQGGVESPVVEWEATWLDPLYRGSGIAKAAYEAVNQWTVNQGFTFATAFIRAENERSQEIRKRQGFAYIYSIRDEKWADGSVDDTHAFIMALNESAPEARRQKALQCLDEVMGYLNSGLHPPPVRQGNQRILLRDVLVAGG